MKSQEIFIAHPETKDQVSALKVFMQALKIKFEVSQNDTNNPDFVDKILESKKQIAEGKFTEVKAENLKSLMSAATVDLWEDLNEAAEEVRLHKKGKLKLKTAQELLHEL